jgi:hypothetical protein
MLIHKRKELYLTLENISNIDYICKLPDEPYFCYIPEDNLYIELSTFRNDYHDHLPYLVTKYVDIIEYIDHYTVEINTDPVVDSVSSLTSYFRKLKFNKILNNGVF